LTISAIFILRDICTKRNKLLASLDLVIEFSNFVNFDIPRNVGFVIIFNN